jgi:hypothetical protein
MNVPPGDLPAQERVAASGQVPGVGQSLGEGHAGAGAEGAGQPGEERIVRLVGGERDREDGRQGGQRSVDQAVHGGLRPLQHERSRVPARPPGQAGRFKDGHRRGPC